MTIDFKKLLLTEPPLWVVVGTFVLMFLVTIFAIYAKVDPSMMQWVILATMLWFGIATTNYRTIRAPKEQDIQVTFMSRDNTQTFYFTGDDYHGYVVKNKARSYSQQLFAEFKCRDIPEGIALCFSALRFLSKTISVEKQSSGYNADDVWLITNIKKLVDNRHWEPILPEYYFYTASSFFPGQPTEETHPRTMITPCVLMVDDGVWDSVAAAFGAIRKCEQFGERCQLDFLQLSLQSPELLTYFEKLCMELQDNDNPTATVTAIFYDHNSRQTIPLILNANWYVNDPKVFNFANRSAWEDQLQIIRNCTNIKSLTEY
jgi:hypothetical protein